MNEQEVRDKYNPIFEFKPGVYYLALWYVNPGRLWYSEEFGEDVPMDWLCMVWKEEKEGADWQLGYRYRYYHSDDPDDQEDVKHVTTAHQSGAKPEVQVIKEIEAIATIMAVSNGSSPHIYAYIGGDYRKAFGVIAEQEFSHTTLVKEDKDA